MKMQLASLVDAPPSGDRWLHEQKFDGYRMLAICEDGEVRLVSRTGKDFTAKFPTVEQALAKLAAELGPTTTVLDGEVTVLMPDGRTSLQALQGSLGSANPNLVYFAFDLLEVGGVDLRALPLEERKRRLAALVPAGSHVLRYSDHIIGRGDEVFAGACRQGLEGIVSKLRSAPYASGRGLAWQKSMCRRRQEVVIGGYAAPSDGSSEWIGSLLVGVYEGGELRYAGKVGTGFSHRELRELRCALDARARPDSPFHPVPPATSSGPDVHWAHPELVCDVAFQEWTSDGRLRHPSFQGLRGDTPPETVAREVERSAR